MEARIKVEHGYAVKTSVLSGAVSSWVAILSLAGSFYIEYNRDHKNLEMTDMLFILIAVILLALSISGAIYYKLNLSYVETKGSFVKICWRGVLTTIRATENSPAELVLDKNLRWWIMMDSEQCITVKFRRKAFPNLASLLYDCKNIKVRQDVFEPKKRRRKGD